VTPDALRRCLSLIALPAQGDYDLNAFARETLALDRQLIPAAVLVPIIMRASGTTLLFTERAADLRDHAGQISFPGGKVDADDADDIATALREAHEEIGLPPEAVDVIGRLGPYETGTRFNISPVVGLILSAPQVVPQTTEVASVFEVPLTFVLNPKNYEIHSRVFHGSLRYFYTITYDGRTIWGATAAILVQFANALGAQVDARA
jgi:8-oxo-dGTP pyrophosphatase MutT (NUDIX family)